MEEAIVREFFDAWSLYDQVLDCNYMFHNELYQGVESLLARHYGCLLYTSDAADE